MKPAALCLFTLTLLGCGSHPKPPLSSGSAEPSDGGEDDTSADADSGSSEGADGGTGAEGNASARPDVISCLTTETTCAELKLDGQDPGPPRERCKAQGGTAKDGPCSQDDVAATCALKNATIYTYKAKDKDKDFNRGLVAGAKTSCKQAKGTFKPTAKPKGGGGKPGKKKGPKP